MKIMVDIKSLVIGFLAAAVLILGISFKNPSSSGGGRYRAVMGDVGLIILDTETGSYKIQPNAFGKMRWKKGDFATTED